jgi:hypothetical protein
MKAFEPIILGIRNEIVMGKYILPIDNFGELNYSYPRSYYSSVEPTLAEFARDNHEIPPLGSSEGRYEWIESAFDRAHIKKSGEIHGLDFDYSSKTERKIPILKAPSCSPPTNTNQNKSYETKPPIVKK